MPLRKPGKPPLRRATGTQSVTSNSVLAITSLDFTPIMVVFRWYQSDTQEYNRFVMTTELIEVLPGSRKMIGAKGNMMYSGTTQSGAAILERTDSFPYQMLPNGFQYHMGSDNGSRNITWVAIG